MGNSNMKIEKHYVINNEKVFPSGQYKGFNLFMNEVSNTLYITDKQNEVFAIVDADCSQNQGYLEIR